MKNIALLIGIVILTIAGCSEKKIIKKDICNISVEVQNYPKDSFILVWKDKEDFKSETIHLKNGKGEIEITTPDLTNLSLINLDDNKSIIIPEGMMPAPAFNFFSENGHQVKLTVDNNNWPEVKISGGKVNSDYMRFLEGVGILEKELYDKNKQSVTTKDTNLQANLNKEKEDIRNRILSKKQNFIKENPSSYVSLYLLQGLIPELSFEEIEKNFTTLDKKLYNTELGVFFKDYIENTKKTAVNQLAPDFEKKDRDGNLIKLSNYKGKYVLLDFWGSWCVPCRKSHPHLIELYKKYSPQGLLFINIAQESSDNRKIWLEAIKKDQLVWTQILNNEDIETSDVVSLYSITVFPTKILIDPEGKIAAKFIGDDTHELDAKLKEIFGN